MSNPNTESRALAQRVIILAEVHHTDARIRAGLASKHDILRHSLQRVGMPASTGAVQR
jgi:hypothetical protein